MPTWRAVPGYEGVYSVSDLGQIRIDIARHNIRAGTLLRQTKDRDGYLRVGLNKTGQRSKGYHVARIVLSAFNGEPAKDQQANHKNGERQDNRATNLEWTTPEKNFEHAIAVLGRDYKGVRNPAARLTEQQVLAIRERAAARESYASLARAFGVTNVAVRLIATGRSWTHIGGKRTGPRPLGRPKKK